MPETAWSLRRVDLGFDRLGLRHGMQGAGVHAKQGEERPAAVVGQKNAKSQSGKHCTGKA
jgi:hypothetical protein